MIDVQDNVLRFFAIDHVLVYFVTIATTGAIFSLQFTKNRLAALPGLRPDPLGELERSPRPFSRKTGGLLLRGGEGREGKGIGWEGRGREGRRKEGAGKEGSGGREGRERREERGRGGGEEGGRGKKGGKGRGGGKGRDMAS